MCRRLGFECFIFLYCVRWGGQYTYSSVVCPVTSASEPFSHGLILIVWLPAGTICVPDRAQVVWLVCQMDYIGERPRVSDRVRQWRRVELSDTDTKFRWTIIIAINTKYNLESSITNSVQYRQGSPLVLRLRIIPIIN